MGCPGCKSGLWLYNVPVAEEDETAEVVGIISFHILNNIIPAEGASVAMLNGADSNVSTHW